MVNYYEEGSDSSDFELKSSKIKYKLVVKKENIKFPAKDVNLNEFLEIKSKILNGISPGYVIPITYFYEALSKNTKNTFDYKTKPCESSYLRKKFHPHHSLLKYISCNKSFLRTFTIKDNEDDQLVVANQQAVYVSKLFSDYKSDVNCYLKRIVFLVFDSILMKNTQIDQAEVLNIKNFNYQITEDPFILVSLFLERLCCKLFSVELAIPLEHLKYVFSEVYMNSSENPIKKISFEKFIRFLESENLKTVIKKKYHSVIITPDTEKDYAYFNFEKIIGNNKNMEKTINSVFETSSKEIKNQVDDCDLKKILGGKYKENDWVSNFWSVIFKIIEECYTKKRIL